ncbi:sugar-binding domain-containing protein [Phocaeicola plebeius]|uniref:sugar-binding domain-containing protein n=1 Tax=Phocaeicola plebeius TaxID=310297 RepID=UPI003AB68380
MKNTLIAWLFCLPFASCTSPVTQMDLSGQWTVCLDSTDVGMDASFGGKLFDTSITLPGTTDEAHLGTKCTLKPALEKPQLLHLTRAYSYVGPAWYSREIQVPSDWKEKDCILHLERVLWNTQVWIDGQKVKGHEESLTTPHEYDLTPYIQPGKKQVLTVRVDNRKRYDMSVNDLAHAYTDATQVKWNGIVGDMYIKAVEKTRVESLQLYPDAASRTVKAVVSIYNSSSQTVPVNLSLQVKGKDDSKSYASVEAQAEAVKGYSTVELTCQLGDNAPLWDEFNPYLYDASVELVSGKSTSLTTETFGLRDIRHEGNKLVLNEKPIFLRGTLECCIFPLTGTPPTDEASWEKLYASAREYGMNHLRFHSWCPPEAAFAAADEMGMYLEIECSSWANQSTTIGDGGDLDCFIWEESERIVREFGNHPSFCMMMYGNEPAGKGSNAYLTNFVTTWKERDARRLYCSGAGWPNLPVNDFLSDSNPRIQAWGQGVKSIINAQAPRTDYDWSEYIGRFQQPMVSHEIGQWCVYPNFKEMAKYDGVMRPRNFEIFQETLAENGMAHLADSFLLASGKLQALCYKADIEAALRTKDFGGFQLLGLSDFPGQGTALVGVLDAFWEEKGYIRPEEYRRFCNSTVPLLRLPKLIYINQETVKGSLEVAHFGAAPLEVTSTAWTLKTKEGKTIASGTLAHQPVGIGNCIPLGQLEIPLDKVDVPSCLTLEAILGDYANS